MVLRHAAGNPEPTVPAWSQYRLNPAQLEGGTA